MLLKYDLDIAQLNAVATDFGLTVTTANVEIVSIGEQTHQIASCIWPLAIDWLPPVTNHDRWTSNDEFALFSRFNKLAVHALSPDVIATTGFPNGHCFLPVFWQLCHLVVCTDICLRWTIEVEKACR